MPVFVLPRSPRGRDAVPLPLHREVHAGLEANELEEGDDEREALLARTGRQVQRILIVEGRLLHREIAYRCPDDAAAESRSGPVFSFSFFPHPKANHDLAPLE